jgi:hypothetical protein
LNCDFNFIEEAFGQYHFIVAVFYKGITLIAKRRLELKSLKHAETCILNGNGYILKGCKFIIWKTEKILK